MNAVTLESSEEEALYVVLKSREDRLGDPLHGLLRKLEKRLFERLTIEELERLSDRYPGGR